ncbi:MAG: AI-2E family transporter [Nitrospirota bacterium]
MRTSGGSTGHLRIVLFLITLAASIAFLAYIPDIVKLVIVSTLLAYVLAPFANFLESRGMSRSAATVLIFFGIVFSAGLAYLTVLPLFAAQIGGLQTGFHPEQAGLVISRFEDFLMPYLSFLGIQELNLLERTQRVTAGAGDWIFSHVLDAASLVTSMILIPFIVFFLLKDGREFKRAFVSLVPNRYFEFSLYLFHKLNAQVGNYLRGQLIDATIVGTLAVFALWVIGVKYFFLIGIFAGLANLIPYFGPLAGAVLALTVSILQTGGLEKAFYVILAFTIIKLLDDAIVQPVVVARSVHMHPLTVLLAVLIGGRLFGILGMLLSVPLVGFLKVVLHEGILNYRRYRAA